MLGSKGAPKPFRSLAVWALLFISSTIGIFLLFRSLPEDEKFGTISEMLPTNLRQLQLFHESLILYTSAHTIHVSIVFSLTYIYKQTFSIPGSVLMNLIGGVIFGLWIGFPLCCFLSTLGASGAYWLSQMIGKEIMEYWMATKLEKLQRMVRAQDMGLLPFLIFIRLFPFTPNWFINMASPIISVPFFYFFLSVFIGLLPYNFVSVQAGSLVTELQSTTDIFTLSTILKLFCCSLIFLAIPLLKRTFSRKVTEIIVEENDQKTL